MNEKRLHFGGHVENTRYNTLRISALGPRTQVTSRVFCGSSYIPRMYQSDRTQNGTVIRRCDLIISAGKGHHILEKSGAITQ
jgi:hypothetical protein